MPFGGSVNSSCDPIVEGDHCDCWELGDPCCLCGEDDDNAGCYPDGYDEDDDDYFDDLDEDDEDYEDDDFEDDDFDFDDGHGPDDMEAQ